LPAFGKSPTPPLPLPFIHRYSPAMVAAILLSALAMTLIVGVRYLMASGGFALATRLRQPGLYRVHKRTFRQPSNSVTPAKAVV
jgi:hypothetical protein